MPTPVTAANFVIAGWGTGATISGIVGTQRRCQLTVTAGTSPVLNPVLTFTYPDGVYPLPPGILARIIGGTGQFTDLTYAPGTVSTDFTYTDIPVLGQTYIFELDTIGI